MWKLKSEIDTVEGWAYVNEAFTKEECQEIISLGESLIPSTATICDGEVSKIRDSKVSWIYPSNESVKIFQKLTDITNALNNKFFNFDLEGFSEGLQFTKYEAPAGRYDLHIDKTFQKHIRKLSLVLQLSDPSDYEGGDLCLKFGSDESIVKKEQGYVTAFPSYVLHGVTPVTQGTRYSLVAWITGPNFK